MKFFLMDNKKTKFILDEKCHSSTRTAEIAQALPITTASLGDNDFEAEFLSNLESYIKDKKFVLSLVLNKSKLTVKIHDPSGYGLLERLQLDDYAKYMRIRVKCKQLHGKSEKEFINFSTEVMRIQEVGLAKYFCEAQVVVPLSFSYMWQSACDLNGFLTITLHLREEAIYSFSNQNKMDKLSICKKILEERVAPDVIIMAVNGITFPCHKSFLSAHSPKLREFFQTNLDKGPCSIIEFPDMAEQSVKAFLSYIYFWDVSKPERDLSIAFDLLCSAHKYEISTLETKMKTLFVFGLPSDYTVDVAIRLYLFSRKLESMEELKKRAIRILKWKNCVDIRNSSVFQTLFKENNEVAMELYIDSLSGQ